MQTGAHLPSTATRPAYRGRLAPSPTGYLHIGHARTFLIAYERARNAGGKLVLRNDDLDRNRVRPEYVSAMLEDLRWLGIEWDEGPDVGGSYGPYAQSERIEKYRAAFEKLRRCEQVYPCSCSRQDVLRALHAPHAGDEEPLYPGTCRARSAAEVPQGRYCWRYRATLDREVRFEDGACGTQTFVAHQHFGDFVVWRQDGLPSYQLACVVDDAEMGITEVVRGADLLLSTARQILLFESLGYCPPGFFHTALVTDAAGVRLAKRHDSLSLRELRKGGRSATEILSKHIATEV